MRRSTLAGLLAIPLLLGWVLLPDRAGQEAAASTGDKSTAPTVKDMKRLLKQAILGGDESALLETLKQLARENGRDPVRAVLDTANALPKNDEKYYWILLEGAASFKQPNSFSEMGDFLVQYRKKPISRDLMHSLQKNRSKYVNRVIRRVLAKCPLDLQLMALDLAGTVRVRRTVDILLPFLEAEEGKTTKAGTPTELRRRLISALEALTLQRFGDSYPNWIGWWTANREKGLKVLRDEAENSEQHTGLVQPLDPVRARDFFGLEEMAGKVLVIRGATARNGYDTNFGQFEEVLHRIGIKPDEWEKGRLEEKDCPSLDRYAAIFINCTQINRFCQSPGHTGGGDVGNRLRRCLGPAPHDNFEGKMKDAALQRLKKYVAKGGQLFTEDWALIEVLEPLWSELVSRGEKLTDGAIDIRASRGQTSHPLLRGVFVPPIRLEEFDWDPEEDFEDEDDKEVYDPTQEDDLGDTDDGGNVTGVGGEEITEESETEDVDIKLIKHQWKVDNESPSIRVNSKKVSVLISSDHLKQETGDPAAAITFNYKKGRVVHVLSHFHKQDSARDRATLENFLVNFLLDVHIRVKKGVR